jgi:hypothetical protein
MPLANRGHAPAARAASGRMFFGKLTAVRFLEKSAAVLLLGPRRNRHQHDSNKEYRQC